MNDYSISRRNALNAMCDNCDAMQPSTGVCTHFPCTRYKAVEKLKPTEPERKRGRWIYDENGMDWNLPAWVCSECHCKNDNIPTVTKFGDDYKRITEPLMWQGSRFCPNCGVRMEEQ